MGLVGEVLGVGAEGIVGARGFVGEGTGVGSFAGETGPGAPGAAHAARNMSAHTPDAALMFIFHPTLAIISGGAGDTA